MAESRAALGRGRSADPAVRRLYYSIARHLLKSGRASDAVKALEQTLKEGGRVPASFEVRLALARAHAATGSPASAIRTYLEAVLDAPARASRILLDAHALLSRSLARTEATWMIDDWAPKARQSTKGTAQRTAILHFLGRVYLYLEDYAASAKMFEEALGLGMRDARVLEGLGESLWRGGDAPAGAEQLRKAEELARRGNHRDRLGAINAKLAQVLAFLGDNEEALRRIGRVRGTRNPYEYELLLARSRAELALSKVDAARSSAEAAISLRPADAEPRIIRSEALMALGRYVEAVQAAEDAIQVEPGRSDIAIYKVRAAIEGDVSAEEAKRLLASLAEEADTRLALESVAMSIANGTAERGNSELFAAEVFRVLGRPAEALDAVDRALTGTIFDGRPFPESRAQALKGELIQGQDAKQAADLMVEAGKGFYYRGDFQRCVDALQSAKAWGGAVDVATERTWSDALMLLALSPHARTRQRELLEESLNMWNRAFAAERPNAETSWFYTLRGRISEALGGLEPASRSELLWQAVAYAEMNLILNDALAGPWMHLGRFYRELDLVTLSLDALRKASQISPSSIGVLDETAIVTANAGRLDEAEEAIRARLQLQVDAWAEGVLAFVLLHQGNFRGALELTDSALQQDPNDMWLRDFRATCLRALGRRAEALREHEAIWQKYTPADIDGLARSGRAAYELGKYSEAIAIEKLRVERTSDYEWGAHEELGLAYLLAGDTVSAREQLIGAVQYAVSPRDLDNALKLDLPEAKLLLKDKPHRDEALRVLDEFEIAVKARLKAWKAPKRPKEVLRDIIERSANAEGGPWTSIGARASLARLNWNTNHDEAASVYRALSHEKEFLEAGAGLARVLNGSNKPRRARSRTKPADK